MENQSRLLPFPTLPNFRGGSLRPGAEPFTPTISFKHGGQQRPSLSMGAPFAGPRPPSHSLKDTSTLSGLVPRQGISPSKSSDGNSYNPKNGNNNYNRNNSALQNSLSIPVSKVQIQDLKAMTSTLNSNHNLRNNQSENQSNEKLSSPEHSRIHAGNGVRGGPLSPPRQPFDVSPHNSFTPRIPPQQPSNKHYSGSTPFSESSTVTSHATTTASQIEDLVHLLTRYFDAVKLCYATNISVAQTFSAILNGDDGASTNAQVAGRFLAFSRESGGRIIDDAQRHKEATANQLVRLVAHLTEAATRADNQEASEKKEGDKPTEDRPDSGDFHRKVVCQSFCSLMHFHNKLANLANVANFDNGSLQSFIDGFNTQTSGDSSHTIFSTAGPLKVYTSSQKPFQIRSDGDALDLVLEMLSAGLTPDSEVSSNGAPSKIPTPPPPPPPLPAHDLSRAPPNQKDDLRSKQPSRFHTLPHSSSATNASLNHQVPSPHASPHHSSLPRNFMPQLAANRSKSLSRYAPPSSVNDESLDRTPTISYSDQNLGESSRNDDANGNSIVNGITSNLLDRKARMDFESAPLFPPHTPATRGGTWPNSILRASRNATSPPDNAASSANVSSSGIPSGDSSLSRDALTNFGPPVDPQRAFENPTMEKEYLNYIASVKLYLANQQQNNRNQNNNLVGDARSHPFSPVNSANNDYSNSSSSSSLLSPSNSIWSRRPYEMIDDFGTNGQDGGGNDDGEGIGIGAIGTVEGEAGPSCLFPILPNGGVSSSSAIADQVLASPDDQLTSILKSIELNSGLPNSQRSDTTLSPSLVNNVLLPSSNDWRDLSSVAEKTKTWPPPRTPWGLVNFISTAPDAVDERAPGNALLQESNIWSGSKVLF